MHLIRVQSRAGLRLSGGVQVSLTRRQWDARRANLEDLGDAPWPKEAGPRRRRFRLREASTFKAGEELGVEDLPSNHMPYEVMEESAPPPAAKPEPPAAPAAKPAAPSGGQDKHSIGKRS